MADYKFPIPRDRSIHKCSAELSAYNDEQQEIIPPSVDGAPINAILAHALICRITNTADKIYEFDAEYDPNTNILDCTMPDELLDVIMDVEVGPKMEKYFSWLTNSNRNLRRDVLQFTIGSNNMLVGTQGIGLQIGYDACIDRIDVLTSTPGDLQIDIRRVPADQWPGSSSNSISGGQPLTISGSDKLIGAPIQLWNKQLSVGDVIVYDVQSVSSIQLVTISLFVTKEIKYST